MFEYLMNLMGCFYGQVSFNPMTGNFQAYCRSILSNCDKKQNRWIMPIRRMDRRGELRRMPQLPWDFYSQPPVQCTCLTIMETIRKLTSCKDCLFVPLCHNSLSGDPCGCWRGRWWPPLHPYCVPYTGLKSKVKVYESCKFINLKRKNLETL